MKIKFLSVADAPDYYEFDGETILFDNEAFDLSDIEAGDQFDGIEHDREAIRDAYRVDGELYVTLTQTAPDGHSYGSEDYIDVDDYDPAETYIKAVGNDDEKESGGDDNGES